MKSETMPVQYNFGDQWHLKIKQLRKNPAVQESFNAILEQCKDIAELICEDGDDQARMEADRYLQEARVLCYELAWLRRQFDNPGLMFLSLEIARALYPQRKWLIVGEEGEDMVITDEHRTMVFDMKNFDALSGAASLTLAQDRHFEPPRSAMEEVFIFRMKRAQHLNEVLTELKRTIEGVKDS
ncbi:MAG: hypothetical protein ACXWRE_01305 [Pseudobdellovibrionaceae bacterium]